MQPFGGWGAVTGSRGAVAIAHLLQAVLVAGALTAAALRGGIPVAAWPAKVAAFPMSPI